MIRRDPPLWKQWELSSLLLWWDHLSGDVYVCLLTVLKWVSREGNLTISQVRALGRAQSQGIFMKRIQRYELKNWFQLSCLHTFLFITCFVCQLFCGLHLKDHFTLFLSFLICQSPSSPLFQMKQSVNLLSSRGQGCINTSFALVLPISVLSFSIVNFFSAQYVSAKVTQLSLYHWMVPVVVPDLRTCLF